MNSNDVNYIHVNFGNKNAPDHAVCPSCAKTKPIKEFKKTVSAQQSRAWKRAGNFPLEIISVNCADCRGPKKRGPAPLTSIAGVRSAMARGEINAIVGARLIASLKAGTKAERKERLRERAAMPRFNQYREMLDELTREQRIASVMLNRALKMNPISATGTWATKKVHYWRTLKSDEDAVFDAERCARSTPPPHSAACRASWTSSSRLTKYCATWGSSPAGYHAGYWPSTLKVGQATSAAASCGA